MQPGRDAFAHETVIGRMKLDRIAAITLGVKAMELRRIFVGLPRQREHVGGAPLLTEGGERGQFRSRAVRFERVLQRHVAREQVDILVGRRLVEYLVRVEAGAGSHGNSPLLRHQP